MIIMGRPKGSKNKTKQEEPTSEEKIKSIRKSLTKPKEQEVKKEKMAEEAEDDKSITEKKVKAEKEELNHAGVTPRIEHPRVPECLVDGGMLYRWLNDVRKTYLEEKVEKKEIKVINEIMDYIMRMEKKQREMKE